MMFVWQRLQKTGAFETENSTKIQYQVTSVASFFFIPRWKNPFERNDKFLFESSVLIWMKTFLSIRQVYCHRYLQTDWKVWSISM